MQETIVAVRVCRDYDPAAVTRAVDDILDDLGGLGAFAGPGRLVLVKPNLLAAEPPERAVTTHPEVVRAAVAAFRAAGAQVLAGDSPGLGSCRGVAERTGVGEAVRSAGGNLAEFDRTVNLGRGDGRRFPVAAEIGRADLVVNLPKLKTHGMMALSGAVKNLFGCIVGLRKPGYHFECRSARELAGLLLDLAAAVAPGLTIMDAVIAMDGPGPRNGRVRPVGLLLGSRDPLALDFALADLLGLSPDQVPHLLLARERGLSAADPAARKLVGADPGRVRINDFQLPPHLKSYDFGVPRAVHGLARQWFTARPRVLRTCSDCGACTAVCPAGAIARERGRARIVQSRCIRCYCCEEMCPHGAIILRQGLVGRLWPWG